MAYSDVVLADGPIAYWQMQEASGNLTDSAGGFTATPTGGPVYRQTGPERVGGFSVGFDDAVAIDYYSAEVTTVNTAASAEVMVEMWFNWAGSVVTNLSSELFAFVLPAATNYAIWIKARDTIDANSALGFNTFNNDAYGILTGGNIATNFWYLGHFAFKQGARNSCRMWINGTEKTPLAEPDGQTPGPATDLDPTVLIAAGAGIQNGLTGRLAHVAVYNKWLAQARINAHWNAANDEMRVRHGGGMGKW